MTDMVEKLAEQIYIADEYGPLKGRTYVFKVKVVQKPNPIGFHARLPGGRRGK